MEDGEHPGPGASDSWETQTASASPAACGPVLDDAGYLRAILESATDYAIIAIDLRGVVTRWNEGARRITGWTAEDAVGVSAQLIFTAEDRAAGEPEAEMRRAARDGRAEDQRWHLRADGERFWANGLTMPLRDGSASHIGYLKLFRDETERHQLQQREALAQARTELALEAAGVGSWDWRPPDGELVWDERCRALFGLGPDTPVTYESAFLAGLHPDDVAQAKAAVARALDPAGPGLFETEYRTVGLQDGMLRWIVAKGRAFFEGERAVRLIGTVRDVTAEKDAERLHRVLAQELEHRIKNVLTLVQSLVTQTLRTAPTADEAGRAITERLEALGRANDLLLRTRWSSAGLRAVVDHAVAGLGQSGERVRIEGPEVEIGPRLAVSLSLALHELGTNAIKYGALSTDGGHVDVRWSTPDTCDGRRFVFTWRETGGPLVVPPARRGFGSRLITATAGAGAGSGLSFEPEGVSWHFDVPLGEVTEG